MKALVYNKKHSPNKLQIKEIEKPIPADGEVLLKIVSVSLNAADYRGLKMGIIPKKRIFGSAVSGIVESVGKNVQYFKPGDEVIGDLSDFGFGGLAEYVAAPEKAFTHKLTNTSFEESATLPVAATTALKALRNKGNIQAGQNTLIVGSSGGVGIYTLQLSNHFGAITTAVCSSKHIELMKELGADHVIDYTRNDFTKENKSYDLILAVNGNYSLLGYRRLLNSKGICVIIGGNLSQIFKSILFGWLLSLGGKKIKTLSAKSNSDDLKFVEELLNEGRIKAAIHKRYSLDQAAEAMDFISKGHSPSKVIVNIERN